MHRREALINSVTEAAALLYQWGIPFEKAVSRALDQYKITDAFGRDVIFKEVCSRLGTRGNKRKQKLVAEKKCPQQVPFHFPPPGKS
jgi:hypothetical protein